MTKEEKIEEAIVTKNYPAAYALILMDICDELKTLNRNISEILVMKRQENNR